MSPVWGLCVELGEILFTVQIDSVRTEIRSVLQRLHSLQTEGLSYSSINLAKTALNICVILPENNIVGLDIDVQQYLKGVFNLKPPKPRYDNIWDAENVLHWTLQKEAPQHSHLEILIQKPVT